MQTIRDHARRELVDALDSVRGRKCLVIDPSLSGPLSLVAEFSLLKEHGVEKIYHLTSDIPESDSKNFIYLCRPKIGLIKLLCAHVKQQSSRAMSSKPEFSIFFVPRRTLVCDGVLEEEGIYGLVTVSEYHLDIVPLDDDLLSMELDETFRELFVEGDTSAIYYVAKAIMKLQAIYGIIPRICGKGTCAKLLSDMLLRMRRELTSSRDDETNSSRVFQARSEIDSVVILDRTVDLITPMCTQLTYEGLLDEVFGIKSTFIELDSTLAAATSMPAAGGAPVVNRPKKVPLNASDKFYSQLRDLNFAVVGGELNQVARRIQGDIEERHQARTVSQIKEFIGKLGGLESERAYLKLHTTLAEQITKHTLEQDFNKMLEVQQNLVAGSIIPAHTDYIEELIDRQAPLQNPLRLLCLHSLVNGGLKPKTYDLFRREIVQTYGFEHLLTFQNLHNVQLLRPLDSAKSNPYPQIRRLLRLIVDDVDEHKPNDISYVYSGYAPISIRLVQGCIASSSAANSPPATPKVGGAPTTTTSTTQSGKPSAASQGGGGGGGGGGVFIGWKGTEEALSLLPGGVFFEEVQKTMDSASALARRVGGASGAGRKITLVVMLGGCTPTEASALRFLSKQEGYREFIILTTNMINGNGVLDAMIEKVPFAA